MKKDDYSDIINLPHHVSVNHPRMTMLQRAAQFAPFAALVGFEESLQEVSDARMATEEDLSPDDSGILAQQA